MSSKFPKISIGVAVYNGQNFIESRLDSILNQSFTDFEVIISDNQSTDLTYKICQEYANKDSRIRLVKQKKNIGMFKNLNFVLEQSIGNYFVFANADDLWEKDFLLKNLNALESNPELVVSMSKIILFGPSSDTFNEKPSDNFIIQKYKKFRRKFRPFNILPISGNYESKAGFCLRKYNFWIQFGLFKRKELLSSQIKIPFYGWDVGFMLNILQYGDVHIVDLPLMKFYSGGASRQGITEFLSQQNIPKQRLMLPHAPLTKWCIAKFGNKFFLKNIDFFIKLNFLEVISELIDWYYQKKISRG